MTRREQNIIKSILQYLHDADHGQRVETQIRAGAFENFNTAAPSVEELRVSLRIANDMGLVCGVPGRFAVGMKWNITDAGEAALLELKA